MLREAADTPKVTSRLIAAVKRAEQQQAALALATRKADEAIAAYPQSLGSAA